MPPPRVNQAPGALGSLGRRPFINRIRPAGSISRTRAVWRSRIKRLQLALHTFGQGLDIQRLGQEGHAALAFQQIGELASA